MSEAPASASFVQRAMWAVAQRNRAAPLNVMILPWRIRGPLDVALLTASLQDVIARHRALRTCLVLGGGQLQQVIGAVEAIDLPVVKVAGPSPQARLTAAMELLRDEGRQPIDLIAGPPIRLRLLQVDEGDHMLCLYAHHAMCDGWSSQIFMRELASIYVARSNVQSAALAQIAQQYTDFAEWQIRTYESGGFAAEVDYWRTELQDPPPPLELPTIAPRKGNRDWRASSPVQFESADLLAKLKQLARSKKSSLFSVLLASVAVLLHHRTGAGDMLIGVSTVNRRSKDEMHLVGCVTNLLPARIRITAESRFDELVGQVHTTVRRLLAYGRIPFELILRELAGPSSGSLLPAVWCQLREPSPATVLETAGLSFEPFQVDRAAILCDLEIDVIESEAGLDCLFAHRQSLFEPQMIAAMGADFGAILHLVVQEDALPVADLCRRACVASAAPAP